MEGERICYFCNYFLSDISDFETGLGVCLRNEKFDPYIEEIFEESSFECCFDLYLEKRIDGNSTCPNFEKAEIREIPESGVDTEDE